MITNDYHNRFADMLELLRVSQYQDVAFKEVERLKPGMPVFSQRIRMHYPDREDGVEWVAWTFDSPTLAQVTAEMQLARPGVAAFQCYNP